MSHRIALLHVARFARLARIARDPQTKAFYSARAELASAHAFRATLELNSGKLFGRWIAPKSRFITSVFASEAW